MGRKKRRLKKLEKEKTDKQPSDSKLNLEKIGFIVTIIGLLIGAFAFGHQYASSKKFEESQVNQTKIVRSSIDEQTSTLLPLINESNIQYGKCVDLIENLSDEFSEFKCPNVEKSDEKQVCISNPTIEAGALRIDECDVARKEFNIHYDGFWLETSFKPLWDKEDYSTHYIIDMIGGNSSEKNRISVFSEGGYLKYSISNKDGTQFILKQDITESGVWNEEGYNKIRINWFVSRMALIVNSNQIDRAYNIDVDMKNSYLFLGSRIDGKYQANGLFDYIRGSPYIYPEPTVVLGPEESLK